ncbi:MAG: hypothetical protein ACOYLI_03615 [Synechococcus lacustris]
MGRNERRNEQGRFIEKQCPLARRVELWLEPNCIEAIDRHCSPRKLGRGRYLQQLLMQLLATDVPVGAFSPGVVLIRLGATGLSNCLVLQQDPARNVLLSSGPEPWLEWQLLPGWNLAVRQQPLEVVGASLQDIAAVWEPALQGLGIEPTDPEYLQLQALCVEALRLEQPEVVPSDAIKAPSARPASDEDLEFFPWDGTPQQSVTK